SPRNAVDAIADDPAAERLARVHTDLVSPPGQRLKLHQGGPIANREPAPARYCFGAMRIGYHLPSRLGGRTLGQRDLDHSRLLIDRATDDRDIIFLNRARLECFLETRARLWSAGKEETAAGVHVEPMRRRRRTFESALQFIQPGRNRIPAAPRSVDRKAGRLVDHEGFGVDEEDAVREQHILSLRGAKRRSNPVFASISGLLRSARNDSRHEAHAVDGFVTPLPQGKESSRLGNINLFPSDLEWLMEASMPLRARNAFGRERGNQQCACC